MLLDLTEVDVARNADFKSDIIESWMASNEPLPDPPSKECLFNEDFFTHPSMYTEQDTLHSAISSRSIRVTSDGSITLKPGAPSQADVSEMVNSTSCRTPEYLELARQRLVTALPWQPQAQSATLDPHTATQPCEADSEGWDTVSSVHDRPLCGCHRALPPPQSIDKVRGGSSVTSLRYACSASEDDSSRDETFDEDFSSTTPSTVFSYCSSRSYFESTNSYDMNGFACASSEPYDWWPPDPPETPSHNELTTQPGPTYHESLVKPPITEGGAVLKLASLGSTQVGANKVTNPPSSKLSRVMATDVVEEDLNNWAGLLTKPRSNQFEICGHPNDLLASYDADSLPSRSDNYRWPGSADKPGLDVQSSPLGGSDCTPRPHPTFPRFRVLKSQAQTKAQITSHPNTLFPGKLLDCYISSSRRNALQLRNNHKDEILVRLRLAGMSYKDIKVKGEFTEAESTLRGRFRTLTKRKDQRVRKPQWCEEDVSYLHRWPYPVRRADSA